MAADDSRPAFEQVDWSGYDGSGRRRSPELVTFLVGLVVLAFVYLYDRFVAHVYLVADWQLARVDYVFLVGSLVLVAFVGVPAVRNRERTAQITASMTDRPVSLAALGILCFIALLGLVGQPLLGSPTFRYHHSFHPPYGFSLPRAMVGRCVGEVTQGEGITSYCHGTPLTYPLGANSQGLSMHWLTARGARTALYVAVFTAAFVVPLAAVVGAVAGFRGGLADDLLMSYVDVQLSIPAIVVYFIGYMYWNPSLLLLLVTFGLLSWGGIARIVRSEVLQRREAGYVMVARSYGASSWYILRRHVLPNSTNTLIPSIFQLIALLILVEAGVAFLGFQEAGVYSWGTTIAQGADPVGADPHASFQFAVGDEPVEPHDVWWISTIPALTLSLTVVSFKLVGDGLRDALDPRTEH